jgi:hypothetical protein
MTFVRLLSIAFYFVVSAEASSTSPKERKRVRLLTGKNMNPRCELSFKNPDDVHCAIVYLDHDRAEKVLNQIWESSKDKNRFSRRKQLSEKATEFYSKFAGKTISAAQLMVPFGTTQRTRINQQTVEIDYKGSRNEICGELLIPRFGEVLNQAGYVSVAGGADSNFLLPFVRIVRLLRTCSDAASYKDLNSISISEFLKLYPEDKTEEDFANENQDASRGNEERDVSDDEDNENELESPAKAGKKTEPSGDGDTLSVDGVQTNMDALNVSGLKEDIERKNQLVNKLLSLHSDLQSIGTDVLEAASRIIYISALFELQDRIMQHKTAIQSESQKTSQMIKITMQVISE